MIICFFCVIIDFCFNFGKQFLHVEQFLVNVKLYQKTITQHSMTYFRRNLCLHYITFIMLSFWNCTIALDYKKIKFQCTLLNFLSLNNYFVHQNDQNDRKQILFNTTGYTNDRYVSRHTDCAVERMETLSVDERLKCGANCHFQLYISFL